MDGATFITRFREETMDEVTPPLWSDSLILRYLDEAQVEFCRRTEGIEDSVSSMCTVQVAEGDALVRLNPKIRKIRAAALVGVNRPLDVVTLEDARRNGVPMHSTHTGVPHTLVQGVGPAAAQLYPRPAVDVSVHLDVFRLPRTSVESPDDVTEVDDRYAQTLMHYALHRAYARPDPDTMDRARSEMMLGQFLQGVEQARREQGRLRHPAGVTVFSW